MREYCARCCALEGASGSRSTRHVSTPSAVSCATKGAAQGVCSSSERSYTTTGRAAQRDGAGGPISARQHSCPTCDVTCARAASQAKGLFFNTSRERGTAVRMAAHTRSTCAPGGSQVRYDALLQRQPGLASATPRSMCWLLGKGPQPCMWPGWVTVRPPTHMRRDLCKVVEGAERDEAVGEAGRRAHGRRVRGGRVTQEAAGQAHQLLRERLRRRRRDQLSARSHCWASSDTPVCWACQLRRSTTQTHFLIAMQLRWRKARLRHLQGRKHPL
jgi:hypothetical protein